MERNFPRLVIYMKVLLKQHLALIILALVVAAISEPAFALRLEDDDAPPPTVESTPQTPPETAPEPEPPKGPRTMTLAVFDFRDEGMHAPGVGRAVSDMLIGRLADDPLIRMFERQRIDELVEEQKRQNPSDMEGNSIRAAKVVGVQFVLMGKVSEFGISENSVWIPDQGTVTKYKARVTMDVRLIQVSDAAVVKTWNTTGAQTSYNLGVNVLGIPNFQFKGRQFEESLLGKATREAVDSAAGMIREDVRGEMLQSLLEDAPLIGRIADVDGNDVILNIGESSGARTGMSLDVFREDKKVLDPDTGEVLLEKRDKIGRVMILHVEDKYSEATIMSMEPGQSIAVGDTVERSAGELEAPEE